MKHIRILTVAVLASLFTLTSCESFFDADFQDQASIENIFKESNTTKQYLRQIYSRIPLDEETVGSDGWVVPRSDEAQFSYYQWVYYINYKTGNYSSATTDFNYWNKFYVAINQCTTFMKYVHLDEKEENERVVPYMMAEARFLRAYYYFCLFRQYGPVFLWYNELPDDNVDGSAIDRHTVEENVKWIVDELDLAAEDLPLTVGEIESADAWMGRVTKGAALALKSRVLLYAASPLYNGTNLYRGQMQNMRGDYLFPQEPDQDKWQDAADAAWDVIDMNMYALYENKTESDPFKKAAASYQGVMLEPWNSETIWGWWWRTSVGVYDYMGTIGASIGCALPPQFGYYEAHGGVAPSLKLVDSYPMMASGRYPVTGYQGQNDMSRPIIDPLSGYNPDGFTENYTQPLNDWGAPIKAHNSCIGRDPRYYASLVPNGFWWPHQNMNRKFTCYDSQEATSRWSADGNCIRAGYAWRRLYKANTNIANGTEAKAIKAVYPAFRLAEIYLNYAEACNEKPERNESDALEYLNKVRRRSGLNDIQIAYPEITGNKELLRWCIQKERMVEFGMEAMRHYDACRWMIAKSEYPGANWTLNVSGKSYEASYNRVSTDFIGAPSIFRDKDYLFPIGSRQLAEMTNMTQNYGH